MKMFGRIAVNSKQKKDRNSMKKALFFLCLLVIPFPGIGQKKAGVYFRTNQLGYLPEEAKTAIVFSNTPVRERFNLITADGRILLRIKPAKIKAPGWGRFEYYYLLDFSAIRDQCACYLQGEKSGARSAGFKIALNSWAGTTDALLEFMRQQRCGYNPALDAVCHQRDGRSFYGPMPDSTYVDVTGGWHDAGDQLKYLMTASYATAHMLKAWQLYPNKFHDKVNALGQPWPNGIPDVLDEARWGLEWILKLQPTPRQLMHQVADDRDHRGWKMPDADISDYGWGANSYRPAYFATGKPQGLGKYKSKATGIANLAGRSAAALAIGAEVWSEYDQLFAIRCRRAAISLYDLGKAQEGFQQGNSYGAPYRYNEITWTDDMEWAAAELYKITKKESYLQDAMRYARHAATTSWMTLDSMSHYEYYPFINIGHFVLHEVVDSGFQDTLEMYYRTEIVSIAKRAETNPYGIGVPFLWCSNNLVTAFITQVILYEKLTKNHEFHDVMLRHRDWLFGKNPWGTSMFTGLLAGGEFPLDVHTSVWVLTGKVVPGGLVDGPVYAAIFNKLKGLELTEPDEFADFQNDHVVYHDDRGDYSTNEPTMDGTAGSMIMMAHWAPEIK